MKTQLLRLLQMTSNIHWFQVLSCENFLPSSRELSIFDFLTVGWAKQDI